ncbi:MAG: phytanoyl-CoA dioxygenase family protein [Saprospiraceae bacterium]
MFLTQFHHQGFQTLPNIYSPSEVTNILTTLKNSNISQQFGVREILLKQPALQPLIFNQKLRALIRQIAPNCNKSIKSIYFDKPPHANWIVNWHQDLTINLQEKKEVVGYKNWRVKAERTVVQPNRELLENIFTLRIHLDDCTVKNGALRVIERSHQNGVIPIKDWMQKKEGTERICEVPRGGVLLMRPLLLHASRRTENQQSRRVIHIECCDLELPNGLNWKEKVAVFM